MKVYQVDSIMGTPDSILQSFFGKDQYSYMYDAPIGMSDNMYINISRSDSVVVSVYKGE